MIESMERRLEEGDEKIEHQPENLPASDVVDDSLPQEVDQKQFTSSKVEETEH